MIFWAISTGESIGKPKPNQPTITPRTFLVLVQDHSAYNSICHLPIVLNYLQPSKRGKKERIDKYEQHKMI